MSECIEWPYTKSNGYGYVTLSGKKQSVHRAVYRLYHGHSPEVVRHRCDNRACYNIEHLEGGTHSDNMQDMKDRDRSTRGEKHPSVKLTNEQVVEIRGRYAAGETYQPFLAKAYGVSNSSISQIVTRRTWQHI